MIDVAAQEVAPDCLPLMVPQAKAWVICGLTRSQWYKLRAERMLPEPVILYKGARPMWRRSDLNKWVEQRERDVDWLSR